MSELSVGESGTGRAMVSKIPIRLSRVMYRLWSSGQSTNPEVPGSIPGATRFSEK
jgi:hypothetical protein